MNNSEIKLEIIRPSIFKELDSVSGYFIPRNPQFSTGKTVVQGLNLGFTPTDQADAVKENRKLVFNRLSHDPAEIALADQVHGTRVQEVAGPGTFSETDGLITRIPGLALGIQVADCAAVLLGDPQQGIVAAIHAGWRGAAGGIMINTVKKMQTLGANTADLRVFISPCISRGHFEVGEEVAEQFPDAFVDYRSFAKPHVDLKAFLVNQLEQLGLQKKHIEIHPGCTFANKNFFSYRREGDQSGRMMGFIKRTS